MVGNPEDRFPHAAAHLMKFFLSFTGWYEGERMRDSERGWFPKEYVSEIVNSHVRARNLRMKYRLLQVSEENGR